MTTDQTTPEPVRWVSRERQQHRCESLRLLCADIEAALVNLPAPVDAQQHIQDVIRRKLRLMGHILGVLEEDMA